MPRVKLTRSFLSGPKTQQRWLPANGASDRESANNVYLGPAEYDVSEEDARRIEDGGFGTRVDD